ncbi:MAG: class B sortase [Clostridium sp.]
MKGKIINRFLIIIGIGLIIFSSISFLGVSNEYKNNSESYDEIKSDIKINEEEGLSKFDFNKLKSENNDFVFWIRIPNSKVDYPVVQGIDNEKYLHRNFENEENKGGALFVDYNNNISEDRNIIIHGHNMRDESMFGDLKNLTNEDKKIYIFKEGKIFEYEIFSFYRVIPNENTYKKVFSDEEYNNYIEEALNRSIYNYNVDNIIESKILTLSTCTNVREDERLIINAKLVNIK